MNFERFGLSRDLLYLGFFIWGAAAAVLFSILVEKLSPRKKSFRVTALFCLASCAIAAHAASIIFSNGRVFGLAPVYPYAVLFFVLGGAAARAAKIGVLANVFAAFLFVLFLSFSFLPYPSLEKPYVLVVRSLGGELQFQSGGESWTSARGGEVISFEAAALTSHPAVPLLGGKKRGLITRVMQNDTELLVPGGGFFRRAGSSPGGGFPGELFFSKERFTGDISAGALPPGVSVSVSFDGKTISFDPPVER